MHIFVNDVAFPTYLQDSTDTIKERISAKLYPDVPLKYLEFIPEDFSPTPGEERISVINLVEPFLNSKDNFPDQLYLSTFENNKRNIKREEVEKLFLINHTTFRKLENSDNIGDYFEVVLNQISGLRIVDAIDTWKKRATERGQMRKLLLQRDERVATFEAFAEEFDRIEETPISEFEETHVEFRIKFKPKRESVLLEELFDIVKTTTDVPFAAIEKQATTRDGSMQFYKVLPKFKIPDEWAQIELLNGLLLKVNYEGVSSRKYTNVLFYVEDDVIIGTFVYPLVIDRNEMNRRVFAALPIFDLMTLVDEEEMVRVGYFYIPYSVNSLIWLDMAMNNKFFYQLLVFNEIVTVSRLTILFMHMLISKRSRLNGPRYTPLQYEIYDTLNMLNKTIVPPSVATNAFPDQRNFTRFRLKCRTLQDVKKYRVIISKLFTLYRVEHKTIEKKYTKIFSAANIPSPDFTTFKDYNVLSETKTIKELVPDLFISSYSRKCLNPPIIVSEKKAQQLINQGKQVMKFPLYGEGAEHLYFCDTEHHSFPGIRTNTLINRDIYPYIPCCYIQDQTAKKNSKLNVYKKQGVKDLESASIVKMLPLQLKQFFSLIADNGACFVSITVDQHPLCLIEAVMTALQILDYDSNIPPTSVVQAHRQMLQDPRTINSCKQELYDYTSEEILTMMTQDVLKPSMFVHLMEEWFEVDIFLFTHDGNMLIPRHEAHYCKFRPSRQTVLLMETDKGFCNIIVQSDAKMSPTLKTNFAPDSLVVRTIWDLYLQTTNYIRLDVSQGVCRQERISLDRIEVFESRNVFKQYIDYYGKCRIILLNDKTTIVVDPVPPFRAAVLSPQELTRLGSVDRFLAKYKLRPLQPYTSLGRVTELDVTDRAAAKTRVTARVTVLTDTPIVAPIVADKARYTSLFKKDVLDLKQYQRNKKDAWVLTQYAIYMFSKYLYNTRANTRSDTAESQVLKFGDTIEVQSNVRYANYESRFSDRSVFVQNNKLLVPSPEIKKRVLYVVYHHYITQRQNTIDFRKLTYIPAFFVSNSDFKATKSVMIKGRENLYRFNQQSVEKDIKTEVDPVSKTPYFIKTKNQKVYLAINTTDLETAVDVAKSDRVDDEVEIYSYVSSEQNLPQNERLVLAYLYNNKKQFTALINICFNII